MTSPLLCFCAFVIKTSRCPNLKGISCRPGRSVCASHHTVDLEELVPNSETLTWTPEFCAPSCFSDRSSPLSTKLKARLIGTHCQGGKNILLIFAHVMKKLREVVASGTAGSRISA